MSGPSNSTWRVGTSGLVLPVSNKKSFPTAFKSKSRLFYYASLFNTIEINSSFYKVPMPTTFEKWSADTPADFRFTVKLWRGITHEKDLHFLPDDLDGFMQAANRIGPKKGCLLIQLPPSLKDDKLAQLEKILHRISQSDPGHPWKIAVEFRNPAWYKQAIYDLLEKYQATIVLHDMPASAIANLPVRSTFVYLRFHGPKGDYKGSYSAEHLQEYAEKIKNWLSLGKDVYTYFNNTIGDAIANLKTLEKSIDQVRSSSLRAQKATAPHAPFLRKGSV